MPVVPSKLEWVAIQEQLSQNSRKIVLEADSGLCFQNYEKYPGQKLYFSS